MMVYSDDDMSLNDIFIGYIIGSYIIIICMVIYDVYLTIKLTGLRYELVHWIFKDDEETQDSYRIFSGVFRFALPKTDDICIHKDDKKRLVAGSVLEISKGVLGYSMLILISPILCIIFLTITLLYSVYSHSAVEIKYSFIGMYSRKKLIIKNTQKDLDSLIYVKNKLKEKVAAKMKILTTLKTLGVKYNQNKGLV